MQTKRMLNLNPCNYSAVVLQICCLCSAAQQHFQILPKEENTVFLMKRMILAPVFVVLFFLNPLLRKYTMVVVVTKS